MLLHHSSHHAPSQRILITAPTDDVVSLADCKTALGIADTSQDGILTAALAGVTGSLDPAAGGWLGRALRPQTWELRLSSFIDHDCRHHHYPLALALPFPKLIQIVSVKYDDSAGVEQTLVENTGFRVLDLGGLGKQAIAPLYNTCWPIARYDHGSVRIRFRSGYNVAVAADPAHVPPIVAVPDEVPKAIVNAIVLGSRMLLSNAAQNLFLSFDRAEGVGEKRYIVSAAANEMLKNAMQSLLSTYRVYG